MLRIDAHNHFWCFDPVRDSWITDDMKVIQRDFLPPDLSALLSEHGFDGCIAVQSDQTEAENEFHLELASRYPFIKGIVGWVDLRDPALPDRLSYYQSQPLIKGFRHVLQGEKDRALMLRPDFKKGIGQLEAFGFTYDILIFPDQLKFAEELAACFPRQKFVIDHIAKPPVRSKQDGTWHADIRSIARLENVYCKVSGMVTEADWENWKAEEFYPYLDTVVESFGTGRIMYGSDWPVCQLAASYTEMLGLVEEYFSSFPPGEQAAFFGGNACTFYNIQS